MVTHGPDTAHPSSTGRLAYRNWQTAVSDWTHGGGGRSPVRGEGAVAGERFLQLADVAEVLNISASQTYALVRSGELPAIKIGGRGQWRVERSALEDYIARCYEQTRDFVASHPLGRDEDLAADPGR